MIGWWSNFRRDSGCAQLVVPSYGLRLVRRFGVQRVGCFWSLASLPWLAHLLEPVGPGGSGFVTELRAERRLCRRFRFVAHRHGAHGHIFFAIRNEARSKEEGPQQPLGEQVERKTASLARANEALQQEIVRRQHAEASSRESEAQYAFSHENPQPMWIFDLQECRF